jgi:putative sterol carrier protein
VAACPVGAISKDGAFDVAACYTHNYREFMGGFTEWVHHVADSKDARDYRSRVSDAESASMWQSLSFGANYKAAYCLAVCPAGEDVIGPFLDSRKDFVADVVRPLQEAVEPVYVIAGSDAEAHVERRFPHKSVRHVRGNLRVDSVAMFARALMLRFQRGRAGTLALRVHFSFDGAERAELTIQIRDGAISVQSGLSGDADLVIAADAKSWLGITNKEKSLFWALVSRRVRVRGPLGLLREFKRCFPG